MMNTRKILSIAVLSLVVLFVSKYFFHALSTKADLISLERISLRSGTQETTGQSNSYASSLSADGNYIVFIGDGDDLVGNDTNGNPDVFVKNRTTGTVERVSIASDGTEANQGVSTNFQPSISADGRYVLFASNSTNLVSGDTNNSEDAFVHDRQTGVTERVDVSSSEIEADSGICGEFAHSSLSADGRYVVFCSYSTNLVASDANGSTADIFLRDRQNGTTQLVDLKTDGTQGDISDGTAPVISADGRYVAFGSDFDFVPEDTNGLTDVYVRDLQNNTTERISTASDGTEGDGPTGQIALSTDGRYVAFSSNATTLVAGDTNTFQDIFLRDRQNHVTTRVSIATGGAEGDDVSDTPSISADGRYVLFASNSTNLVSGDTNSIADIFVRDTQAATTSRVSLANNGAESTSPSHDASISANARYVLFSSEDPVLVDNDTNGHDDIFIRDLQADTTKWAISFQKPIEADNDSGLPSMSQDNNLVVFTSSATNLVDNDTNNARDIFLLNRSSGAIQRISVASDGTQSDADSTVPVISADGRYVAFSSDATNLVPGDTNATTDVFVRDLQNNITERVSVSSSEVEGNNGSDIPAISADGRYVTFESLADNLVAGDTNTAVDIFVRDRQLGETTRVSVSSGGVEANDRSSTATISGDGRYVTFTSQASNLVTGDTNGGDDIFLHDLIGGNTTRINVRITQSHGNGGSYGPYLSGDSNYVAFSSGATDLVTGDTNGQQDIFVLNRSLGTIERVSVSSGGVEANGPSFSPTISADGRFVTFSSDATNLVAGDTNGVLDIFLRDRQNNTTTRISISSGGTQSNNTSDEPIISDDGTSVAYHSDATNLVAGDTNNQTDVFVRNLTNNQTELISKNNSGVIGDGYSTNQAISSDGRYVSFISNSENFVVAGSAGAGQVYRYDRQTNTIEQLSKTTGDIPGDSDSVKTSISANGRYIAFNSYASNLVSGDLNATVDTFVVDAQTGIIQRVSISSSGVECDNGSTGAVKISGDGTAVAFYSDATNLVTSDTNDKTDLFLRDISAGTTERVSVSSTSQQGTEPETGGFSLSTDGTSVIFSSDSLLADGINTSGGNLYIRDRGQHTTDYIIPGTETEYQADQSSDSPRISLNGSYIAFNSQATNLVSGDTNNQSDIFVYQRSSGNIERVSIASDGTEANGGSFSPTISSDGRAVGFYSYADNLVSGDTNDLPDVFLRDRTLGTTLRANVAMDGSQVTTDDSNANYGLTVSPDGAYVTFASGSSNLVPQDTNDVVDIFLAKVRNTETTSSGGGSSLPHTHFSAPLNLYPVPSGPTTGQGVQPEQPELMACIPSHFDTYLRRGAIGLKVVRIQQFLTKEGFYTGPVNGYLGPKTEKAIKGFQLEYKEEILIPWKRTIPTGIWGITTRAKANQLDGCNEGDIVLPSGASIHF